MHVDHFTFGVVTPMLSYALSVLGSALGLVCTVRARNMTDRKQRARWLARAAWAIGGTGIWTMHIMAMLGFSVAGVTIRYDLAMTVASWITAIVVVGIGLFIVGYGKPSAPKILVAGTLTGIGVAGMHYTGMAAMRLDGSFGYDPLRVTLSVVIAIVAATVALWLAMTVRRALAIGASALVMGIAVNGMHFTGMSALSVHLHESRGPAYPIWCSPSPLETRTAITHSPNVPARSPTRSWRGAGIRAAGSMTPMSQSGITCPPSPDSPG